MVNKQRILIVDDDENIAELVSLYLIQECFDTNIVLDGEAALEAVKTYQPDLMLLDIMLPGIDGHEVLRRLRRTSNLPVILLSAKGEVFDKVLGLELGADDYIVKPFSVKVLMEKIQTVLRRCSGAQGQKVYTAGSLSVDLENRIVKSRGNVVSLTPTEFEILEVFCRNRDQILTKDILLEKIWDRKENYVNEHTLSLNVSRLRNKIADGER